MKKLLRNLKFLLPVILLIANYPLLSAPFPNQIPFQAETRYINACSDSIQKFSDDSSKIFFNNTISKTLERILIKSESYSNNFDSLRHIGRVRSPDNKFRIITWNLPFADGSQENFGIIQMNPYSDSTCKIFKLQDKSKNFNGDINLARFIPENWFGALYYEIFSNKAGKQIVYTILGMHFNGFFTNKKIIESMYFDEHETPVFGRPIFEYNGQLQDRIVFEYSIDVKMILRFDQHLNMIIFDHLAPPSPLYNGNHKFYGPDFTFDGLKFEKNKWVYYPNVDYHK